MKKFVILIHFHTFASLLIDVRVKMSFYIEFFHTFALNKKRPTILRLSAFLVPLDVLFSNEFLRDLSRLWELRTLVPDPSNLSANK